MVDNGFCIIHGNISTDISLLAHCYSGNIQMLCHGCLFTGAETPLQTYRFATGNAYFIGTLHNGPMLRSLAGHFEGGDRVVNNAEALYQLSEQLGIAVLGLAEGDFCFFIEDNAGTLTILTDPHGRDPLYLVSAGDRWITNRLKLIGAEDDSESPSTDIPSPETRKTIQRIHPGTLNVIHFDTCSRPVYESRLMLRPADNRISVGGAA